MSWAADAVFYHLFPLGAAGAPARNDFTSAPSNAFDRLLPWIEHAADLGATALLLGPVFESTAHGYDTADYCHVDRRLGDNESLVRFAEVAHRRGLRLVLDGVFNHVGRDFWAFKDVQAHGAASPYRDWFYLDFARRSPAGDAFWYAGWNEHYDLVKLNTEQPAVREHLFSAARSWIDQFGIDGLRLDAADSLDRGFQRELATFCRGLRSDFWLMGEVIHGDYRQWAGPGALDSVTNYELYKGLYSSHLDRNYFEVAYSLSRQSGETGLYRDLSLYTFADNHDVDRVAALLEEPADLYTLYALLFTAPGVPGIYYGSEWGLAARKASDTDAPLRPALDPVTAVSQAPHPELAAHIRRLAHLRRSHPALRHGAYRQLHVAAEQLAFLRTTPDETLAIVVNAAPTIVSLPLGGAPGKDLDAVVDLLNDNSTVRLEGNAASVLVPPHGVRVLRVG